MDSRVEQEDVGHVAGRAMALAHLSIGGVEFQLQSRDIRSAVYSNACYRPFVSPAVAGRGDRAIPVELTTEPVPAGYVKSQVFDGVGWRLYRDGKRRIVACIPLGEKEPAWAACFEPAMEKVTLYCGRRMVKAPGVVECPLSYPLDQVLLMYALAQRGGCILHAAGGAIRGRGLVFVGRSGAGKTTLSRLLAEQGVGPLLSDDRILARVSESGATQHGTPWPGDAGISLNRSLPLDGWMFLHQSPANRAERLTPAETVERLMPLASIPWFDPEVFPAALSVLEELALRTPAYKFYFQNAPAVVPWLEEMAGAWPGIGDKQ